MATKELSLEHANFVMTFLFSCIQKCMSFNLQFLTEAEKKPISIIDFPLHVRRMHENQDYPFSKEFEVSQSTV